MLLRTRYHCSVVRLPATLYLRGTVEQTIAMTLWQEGFRRNRFRESAVLHNVSRSMRRRAGTVVDKSSADDGVNSSSQNRKPSIQRISVMPWRSGASAARQNSGERYSSRSESNPAQIHHLCEMKSVRTGASGIARLNSLSFS